jgi:putative acetyltransferase
VKIRHFTSSDADAVYEVHRRAFDGRTEESRIVQRLHDADKAVVSLVAVENGRAVGHILFSLATVIDREENSTIVGLAPVGVLPENQHR